MTTIFETQFQSCLPKIIDELQSTDKHWKIKGFIDSQEHIYEITNDTKVVSKLIEIIIFPLVLEFENSFNYHFFPTQHQNHSPDVSFVHKKTNEKIALDIKTTYRKNPYTVNGMTLGAFTGYFRDRTSTKNILYPYNDYSAHYVLGIIYTRREGKENTKKYLLSEISQIEPVAEDFQIFLQEKWKISTDIPGSGNTKNIGGITNIDDLLHGRGPFTSFVDGKKIFDDYWMNYKTKGMAKENNLEQTYHNLEEYLNKTKI